jgi:transposase
MHTVEMYAAVRRAVYVEGISEREAARRFGLSRVTVHKMLQFSVPPRYQRTKPIRRPKLEPYIGLIEQMLQEDKERPKKQRHTAQRIFERLRDEHGYDGGITIVRDYVRGQKQQSQEMFVPLSHPPGDAQVDFGEADVLLAGVLKRVHYFVLDLPHSDDAFVMAFPAETSEAFCEGHNHAFAYFGGVPRHILYDNSKLAVARFLADGGGGQRGRPIRQLTKVFRELQSHYLFEERFARPRKGNEKGKVEGLVGYARRHFFVPLPRVGSFDELNALLLERCQKRRAYRLRGHQESIGQRLERDQQGFLPLPAKPYEACEMQATRVTSLSLVRYRSNDYSVPTRYGHRDVVVKGYVHQVVIACGSEVIARHARSYEKEDFIYDPLHYLALLEQKSNALDQAAPLQEWELPEEFAQLRRLLEARLGKNGRREYIQILRLLECFSLESVHQAAREALRLQAISFDALKHLVLCGIEKRPARLDLGNYPHLPTAQVSITMATDYMSLLSPLSQGSKEVTYEQR